MIHTADHGIFSFAEKLYVFNVVKDGSLVWL